MLFLPEFLPILLRILQGYFKLSARIQTEWTEVSVTLKVGTLSEVNQPTLQTQLAQCSQAALQLISVVEI